MKRNLKRYLSLFLALILVIGLFPAAALAEDTAILSAEVTITAPAAGAYPDYNPVLPANANYYSDDYSSSTYQNEVRWTDVTTDQDLTVGEDMFLAGHQYQVTITLTANDGYAFSADTTATVNGQSAETFVRSHYGQVIITYTFETEEGVEINEVNFPDPVFRSHVAANFDTNGDGWLVNAEIAAITSLAMEDYTELTSVQGIGFFTELSYVMIDGSPSLTELDLSQNTKLTGLEIYHNGLTSLILGEQPALEKILADHNALTAVDLSGAPNLLRLDLRNNQLTELDLSANTALEGLFAYQNKLSSLDLRSNTQLKHLSAEGMDSLTSLNLSGLTKLGDLDVSDCNLTSLDVSDCPLSYLECDHNPLETLILGEQEELKDLYCYAVELQELDISGCPCLADAWLNGTHEEYEWGLEVSGGTLGGYMELDMTVNVVASTTSDHVPGDINGDGKVNNKDVTRLQRYLKGAAVDVNEAALDVNGDGKVNNKDLTRLQRYVKGADVEIH
ncbi:MAG: hypothetical protein IKH34_05005 [Oscillospiraceae bacterium]|nr:hypothetical protein [Oscillospiraceae bacterium]